VKGIIIGILLSCLIWIIAIGPCVYVFLRMDEKQNKQIKHLEDITTVLEPAKEHTDGTDTGH